MLKAKLTKSELEQIKGGHALMQKNISTDNDNDSYGCKCYFSNYNSFSNNNGADQCSCVCE